MTKDEALLAYTLRLGDNALILGQRLVELVAAGPELEEELANANFALDFIGQARMFYSYAGEIEGKGRCEDDFAFLRDDREFANFLLVEQPNGHFGDTIVRQVLFDSFYGLQLEALTKCKDKRLAEIAVRAGKEICYHLRHTSQWLVRLGDGTAESHGRATEALGRLWRYAGEMFAGDEVDIILQSAFDGPDLETIEAQWSLKVAAILDDATLAIPDEKWTISGGRQGRHSESMGFLITEMQILQRAYPGATW